MLHKHKCPKCKLVWEHLGPEAVDYHDEAEYAAAHACPGCGTDQREWHRSKEEPTVSHRVQVRRIRPDAPPPSVLGFLELLTALSEAGDRRLKRLDKNRAA
jgi:hypothetical protein